MARIVSTHPPFCCLPFHLSRTLFLWFSFSVFFTIFPFLSIASLHFLRDLTPILTIGGLQRLWP